MALDLYRQYLRLCDTDGWTCVRRGMLVRYVTRGASANGPAQQFATAFLESRCFTCCCSSTCKAVVGAYHRTAALSFGRVLHTAIAICSNLRVRLAVKSLLRRRGFCALTGDLHLAVEVSSQAAYLRIELINEA